MRDEWLSTTETRALRAWGEAQLAGGRLRRAGIGADAANREDIRGDQILWLTPADSPLIAELWQKLELLRSELAQGLFLGLSHFEIHLALYPPGRAYQAHVDQLQTTTALSGRRVLSTVLYLNDAWTEADGGELCLLDPQDPTVVSRRILPVGGRLALFRSDTILHEVKAPRRERWSLTGWFRQS